MIRVTVQTDIKRLTQQLREYEKKQIPFATVLALTRTAKFAQAKVGEEIKRSFDRPKPYTLNATFIKPAKRDRLMAEVKLRDEAFKSVPPVKWLQAQVDGGRRRKKAYENLLIRSGSMPSSAYTVPTKFASRDGYGNIMPSEINKILSDLQANRDTLRNATQESKKRRLKSRKVRPEFYFSTLPQTYRTRHLAPGIYKRTLTGFGAAIKPILLFVDSATYSKRLRFYETADQVSRMRFPLEFKLALRDALRTAK